MVAASRVVPSLFVLAVHFPRNFAMAVSSSKTTTMDVTDAIKASLPQVYQADFVPIDFTVGVQEGAAVTFRQAAVDNSGEHGSIAFIVRRSG